jgi:nitroimidazol reductase NimA-like FMN-containing flavoprotein (pyridoxamine 5'-phosphate oxidase superfamily)
MPRLSDAELAEFLDQPGILVRIGTVDDDGVPRVVPTWFIHRDGEILFTPREASVFLENLRRDPRVGLSIDEEPLPYRKVTVQGEARMVHDVGDDDAWRDLYREIAYRYVPREQADDYVDNTIDQPRALLAVPLAGSRVTTWRMPVEDEDGTGIWHRRYYRDGTIMANLADQADGA